MPYKTDLHSMTTTGMSEEKHKQLRRKDQIQNQKKPTFIFTS